jgi:hypothetical protein
VNRVYLFLITLVLLLMPGGLVVACIAAFLSRKKLHGAVRAALPARDSTAESLSQRPQGGKPCGTSSRASFGASVVRWQ